MSPLLEVEDLTVTFPRARSRERVVAVDHVELRVEEGASVAVVGGSGAGKSTLARAVAGLVAPDAGRIAFEGRDLGRVPPQEQRRLRRSMHLVFQDPYASLPPTLSVAAVVEEPLVIHRLGDRAERRQAVLDALAAVHLTPVEGFVARHPHQLSGGERQRVALARALVTEPRLILADEPTRMLDASLRVAMVDLLDELRTSRGLAVVHITHDVALAQRCTSLVVLQAGRVVETGPTEAVLAAPRHPYTAALIDAARRLKRPLAAAS